MTLILLFFIPLYTLVDNSSAKNKASNRRVEFVLEKEKDA